MSGQQSPGGRRTPLPPSPLRDELVRAHLVERLGARFDLAITTVVAGAGFGKTTALAQAMRANEAAPRGIDAWIACEPGDEDSGRFSAAILSALGARAQGGSNIDRVLGALGAIAPVDVCLVIDDLQELPAKSAGEQLLRELTWRLPPHVHLVLASRRSVPIPLARRRAAGQVVEVGADALAFTATEVSALAAALGEDHTPCDQLAGWPSLVRLVLSAPPGAARQFLWEEIVAGMSPNDRAGLLALSMLGSGTPDDVAHVAGCRVDLERLVGVVPLIHEDRLGTLGAHHLWEEVAERIFSAGEVLAVRRRALHLLHDRGETVRMGSAAVRWGDADMFRVACVALVRESLGVIPADTAARWLAGTPPVAVDTLEHRLLVLALRFAQCRFQHDMDVELDLLEAGFGERADTDARAVVLALGTVSSQARGDVARLLVLAERIRALPGVTRQPELQFFMGAVDAAFASLAGDVAGCLATIDAMSFEQVSPLVGELVTRLHATMLVLSGRADEAVRIVGAFHQSPHAYVRSVPAMLRWLAGDPSDYLTSPLAMQPLLGDELYRFVSTAHVAGVAASLGDRELADLVRTDVEATIGKTLDVRDSAIAATAVACVRILDHDERAAEAAITDYVSLHPLSDPRGEVRLRRNLAIAYVLDVRVREYWDAAELGSIHRRTREVARQLLAARAGHLDRRVEVGTPATVITSLPLTWSVELAIRAIAAGCPGAENLLRTLAAWLPNPTRSEVEWLAANTEPVCKAIASGLLGDLRSLTEPSLNVEVLGTLRLRTGDDELDSPELRRGRVRTLLGLLVLKGRLPRERICDLLWPDLQPDNAAQNLRVTLSRLRRLLEPDRAAGQASTRLRSHADAIELAAPPLVDTDLGKFRAYVAAADQAHQFGDTAEEIECLTRAVGQWRGDPLPDLQSLDELVGEIEFIRASLVDGCLRLGELLMVAGRFDESLLCAERSRVASPYSERAHRLAIACHLQRRDHLALESAVRSTRALLAELDVAPEDATNMLLRRATVRLGTDPQG